MDQIEKPPVGLVPRFIRDSQRLNEISEAIHRYFIAKKVLPVAWLDEYIEIVDRQKNKK